jgi:hypothetical protein
LPGPPNFSVRPWVLAIYCYTQNSIVIHNILKILTVTAFKTTWNLWNIQMSNAIYILLGYISRYEQVFYDKFLCDKFYLLVCTRNFDKFLYEKYICSKASMLARKNCQSTNFVRLYGSTKKTCQSNLSIWCDWSACY